MTADSTAGYEVPRFQVHSFSARCSLFSAMSQTLLIPLLLALDWTRSSGNIILNVADKTRQRQIRKKEDYSFHGQLKRATEECSYIARNSDFNEKRLKAIQKIKDQMNNLKVSQFYQQQEQEKNKSMGYYNEVEKRARKAFMGGGPRAPNPRSQPPPRNNGNNDKPPPRRNFPNGSSPGRRRRPPAKIRRGPPSPMVLHQPPIVPHGVFKRSQDPSFSQGTFKDHNNCFSRCVFARLELVDFLGFPQESIIRKAIEDYIDNRRSRRRKLRRALRCFDDLKTVAIDDNCIYSTRVFKCMNFDDPEAWH